MSEASEKDFPTEYLEVNSEPTRLQFLHRVTALLAHYGVETHGIVPVPVAERTDTRWYQMFLVWFSSNMNIATFGIGTAGPAFFSLGVRDAILTIVMTNLLSGLVPAFFAVFGPKLGTRAMVQSRFSWGYYGSMIPCILNVFSMQAYLVLYCIIGGQTLASVSPHLNDTVGIVIISVISLIVTFFGYRFLHWFESVAWFPNIIAFIAMVVLGYPQLYATQSVAVPTPTPSSVLSFASTLASNCIGWCTITPDYGVYHSPATSSARIFFYTYLGFVIPNITAEILGAAFAAAAPNVPAWNVAFQGGTSVGGLLYGVLAPLGDLGKFLTVLVALTVASTCVPTMYTFSTSLMSVAHSFSHVPRWVYILVSGAISIPLAIVGASKFYTALVDILSVIGYWSTAFAGIAITEHVLFRGASFSETAYPVAVWDTPVLLPRSIPAISAFICAVGALVPFMSQAWYVGSVAKASGDCGMYVGFVVSAVCYAVLRGLEGWRRRGSETSGRVECAGGEDGLKV